jgi:hypothetical protein
VAIAVAIAIAEAINMTIAVAIAVAIAEATNMTVAVAIPVAIAVAINMAVAMAIAFREGRLRSHRSRCELIAIRLNECQKVLVFEKLRQHGHAGTLRPLLRIREQQLRY